MALVQGLEPRTAESESDVLPLHHTSLYGINFHLFHLIMSQLIRLGHIVFILFRQRYLLKRVAFVPTYWRRAQDSNLQVVSDQMPSKHLPHRPDTRHMWSF